MSEQLGFDIELGALEVPASAPPPPRPPRRRRPQPEGQGRLIQLPPARPEKPAEILTPQRASWKLAQLVDRVCQRGHSHHQVFDDFLSIGISTLLADDESYMRVIKPYGRAELEVFAEAFGLVLQQAQEGFHDVIGPAYEELGSRHRRAGFGQYFTPWNLAVLMAEMQLVDLKPHDDGRPITVHDPCVGAGVLLLAAADVIQRRCPELWQPPGVQFSGQDIDRTCCLMARLNLIVHGLSEQARVVAAVLSAPERARREVA